MDFFIFSQDLSVPNPVQPVGILKVIEKDKIKKENLHKMDGLAVQLEVKDSQSSVHVDFLETPIPLVSDKLKELLTKFEDRVFFKPVLLADIKNKKQDLYWLMVPEGLECLSEKSEFNKNGTLKNIVIDENRVKYRKIFKIDGILENIIIFRLDVAESLLRRDFTGIRLKRVEKD